MVFSSLLFLSVFFPVVLAGYWLVHDGSQLKKNMWLLICSMVFYGWGGVQYLLLICASILVNWILGLTVGAIGKGRKLFVALDIIFNLALLGFFKYFNFFVDSINSILYMTNLPVISAPVIPLPIGISFFTFQIMSYVIDVYRGKVMPQRKLLYVALYVSFFPQLIAGPIVRYVDVAREIEERQSTIDDVVYGMRRFIMGLAKKVLISNEVAYIADMIFDNVGAQTMPLTWLGILCYSLQIYFDFSGYSDMAIGMGRIFGFHFLENFNYPYVAKSIQDFWRRWHISLSSWFRDYVYIPLGGNRCGKHRTMLNLCIVFLLTGFWHGASWNFVVWGVFHGIFQLLERNSQIQQLMRKTPTIVLHIYTLLVVMVGWVFFRADTLQEAVEYLRNMFSFDFTPNTVSDALLNRKAVFVVTLGIILSTPFVPRIMKKVHALCNHTMRCTLTIISGILLLVLLLICLSNLAAGGFNPFIYFRF